LIISPPPTPGGVVWIIRRIYLWLTLDGASRAALSPHEPSLIVPLECNETRFPRTESFFHPRKIWRELTRSASTSACCSQIFVTGFLIIQSLSARYVPDLPSMTAYRFCESLAPLPTPSFGPVADVSLSQIRLSFPMLAFSVRQFSFRGTPTPFQAAATPL